MKRIALEEINREERIAIEKSMLTEGAFTVTMVLVEKLGSEAALDALRPYARMAGHAFTINMQQMFEIKGSDIERIALVSQLYDEFMAGSEYSGQEIEREEEKIVRVFPKCVFNSGPKESCIWAHEMFTNSVCEAINPEYECRFTQMLTKGDPMCSYVIEKKKK